MALSGPYRWLMLAGGVALAALLPLALLVILSGKQQGLPSDAGMALLFYLIGAFAVWKRPAHLAARRLPLVGVLYGAGLLIGRALTLAGLRYGRVPGFWIGSSLVRAFDTAALCALLALLVVFPDGRYHRAYERWIARASWLLVPAVPLLLLLALPQLSINTYEIWPGPNVGSPSPLFLPALAWAGGLALGLEDAVYLLVPLGVGLLALRVRRLEAEQRRQAAWPLLAAAAFGLAVLPAILAEYGLFPRRLAIALFDLTIMLLPIAIGIGLLRHRLFDIQVVLRKSVAYAGLWLAITLGYAGLAAALGITAGERLPIGLAVAFTILATLLFQPARGWLERLAARLVYGERVTSYDLLTRFGATLENTADQQDLIPRVLAAIRQGLGVRWVRISLRRGRGDAARLEPIGADGLAVDETAAPAVTAPLVHAGEQIGTIDCGPKLEGSFDRRDHELLATLGRQAALALRNAWLAAELAERLDQIERQARELAESRGRIVRAEEDERRRIERNLHDGVQQELVALLAKLRLARNQLARDPQLAERTLAELQDDTRQALDDLRELAHGIHPPVLSDRGLLEALEARAARLPIGVTVAPDGVGRGTRFAAAIEGAAYYFVCEALANVLKHAAAERVSIRLAATTDALRVEVTDDGRGFDPSLAAASGLRGLSDRLEALGGRLSIASQPGRGTTLAATLPIGESQDG